MGLVNEQQAADMIEILARVADALEETRDQMQRGFYVDAHPAGGWVIVPKV